MVHRHQTPGRASTSRSPARVSRAAAQGRAGSARICRIAPGQPPHAATRARCHAASGPSRAPISRASAIARPPARKAGRHGLPPRAAQLQPHRQPRDQNARIPGPERGIAARLPCRARPIRGAKARLAPVPGRGRGINLARPRGSSPAWLAPSRRRRWAISARRHGGDPGGDSRNAAPACGRISPHRRGWRRCRCRQKAGDHGPCRIADASAGAMSASVPGWSRRAMRRWRALPRRPIWPVAGPVPQSDAGPAKR